MGQGLHILWEWLVMSEDGWYDPMFDSKCKRAVEAMKHQAARMLQRNICLKLTHVERNGRETLSSPEELEDTHPPSVLMNGSLSLMMNSASFHQWV
jgi:hypothetical protein